MRAAVAAVLVAVTALSACARPAGPAGAAENSLTYLEPQFFNTLYPPAAGYYANGAVVNNITDRLLYQDPETLELSDPFEPHPEGLEHMVELAGGPR